MRRGQSRNDSRLPVGRSLRKVNLRCQAETKNDGTVASSEIDHIDPPSATSLGASALSALKAWRFNPARDRDKAIASTAVVPIVFGANAQSSPAVARIRNSLDPIRMTPRPG